MERSSSIYLTIILLSFIYFSCSSNPQQNNNTGINLPPGFKISIYSDKVPGARSMALSTNGILFVGTRNEGNVYAIVDTNKDNHADKIYTIAENLSMPNGVAFKNGSLFVAEVNRILRFDDIENRLSNPPKPIILFDKFPDITHHGWKFIRFGPDGKLYVPVGAPCNICLSDDKIFATITRMNIDGSSFEIFANGIRNSVGFDWNPLTNVLWFTDNGRDMLGDDIPPDELNRAPIKGLRFGYPFFHGKGIQDPEFGDGKYQNDYINPMQELGPHVAALGMRFYTGNMFPVEYKNQIFIAEHGSWNRSEKIGYRITVVKLVNNKPVSYEPFATGWLQGNTVKGRPVDLQIKQDGSMLVSDDYSDVIYRISYDK
ncbi:MAG: sorbosone dehydrogenase [Ignavibacteriales bacterium CG_4_9_14_3_um_filter_30_11]|nr:MAG: sorbosone dehydrogenase [Ignavibacteriales bacterium CG_4_9_14_3_um_filter_30_11]